MAENKKQIDLTMDPLMMLSIMALFMAMGVIFLLNNAKTSARAARAAQPEVIYVLVTPTPEADDVIMEK